MHELAQIQLFGPDFRSFLAHSYGDDPANDRKSVLKLLNFRYDSHNPTDPVCFYANAGVNQLTNKEISQLIKDMKPLVAVRWRLLIISVGC